MQKKQYLRLFTIVMAVAMLVGFCPIGSSVVEAAAADRQSVMPLNANPASWFWEFGANEEVAFKVTAGADFNGTYLYLANSGANSVLNVKVYAWDTDYATTTAGLAAVDQNVDIAAGRGDDYNSRASTGTEIRFSKILEAGTYLVAYSKVSGSITHSINVLSSRVSGVEFFRNGGSPRSEWDTIVGGILYAPTKQEVMPIASNAAAMFWDFGTDEIAFKVTAKADFNGTYLYLANSGSNSVLNVKVYAWNTDYATTTAGTAIVDKNEDIAAWRGDDYNSRAATGTEIKFGKNVPAGTYLITFAKVSGSITHSINLLASRASGVEFFRNGGSPRSEWDTIVGGILYAPKKQAIMNPNTANNWFSGFGSNVIGARFTADAAFDGSYIYLANIGAQAVLNVKVYAWNTDYATTTAGAALVDYDAILPPWQGDDYLDRLDTGHKIRFDRCVSAGEYLITYQIVSGSQDRYIDLAANKAAGVTSFFTNGAVSTSEHSTFVGGVLYCTQASFVGAEVTLQDNINIDFLAKLPDAEASKEITAIMEFKGEEIPVEPVVTGNNVRISFIDILPQEIGEKITVRLYADEVLIAKKANYSIQTYCERIMPTEGDADNAELRDLLIALLNYGTESQKYFEGQTESFANASLEDAEIVSVNQNMSEAQTVKAVSTKTDANNYWKSATVGLFNTVQIRLKFYTNDISKVVVKMGAEEIDSFETVGEGIYYVVYDQFTANEFDSALEAQLCVDGAPVQTATYSVNSYVNSYVNSGKDSTDEAYGLIQAIYDYGCAAKAYVG